MCNRGSGTELSWALGISSCTRRHLVLLEVAYPGSSGMRLQMSALGGFQDLTPTPTLLCLGQAPLGVADALLGPLSDTSARLGPRCQSASLEGNKHVLIKTKHFQTGVSCWNFLAAPKAVVITETLPGFFLRKGCGGRTVVIVLASSFRAELARVVTEEAA